MRWPSQNVLKMYDVATSMRLKLQGRFRRGEIFLGNIYGLRKLMRAERIGTVVAKEESEQEG